ncbi:MAG: FAD-dependent oxidoreductase, partial [Kangiellaceae bacterium]|nr:FAD-dependent oxidoreductase [Kangiellaceae bacterium]
MSYLEPVENLIIGGGLAGLLAAWQLEKINAPYILLEAKPSLGGRILSANDDSSGHLHDLGPTWIFPHQKNIQNLLADLELSFFDQYCNGDILFQQQANQRIVRTTLDNKDKMYRVIGGMATVIDSLYAKVDAKKVKLHHYVEHLSREDDVWRISAISNSVTVKFDAKNLILALPPRMVSAHLTTNEWASPSLANDFAHTPTWMAAQAKFIATYSTPFWREQNLSGQAFSQH